MFQHDAVNHGLLAYLAREGLEHANYWRVLDVLLIHDPVEELQLFTFVVETLNLISFKDLHRILLACLYLHYLEEAHRSSTRLYVKAEHTTGWSALGVLRSDVFGRGIQESLALEDSSFLHYNPDVIVVHLIIRERYGRVACNVSQYLFGVRQKTHWPVPACVRLLQLVFECERVWELFGELLPLMPGHVE